MVMSSHPSSCTLVPLEKLKVQTCVPSDITSFSSFELYVCDKCKKRVGCLVSYLIETITLEFIFFFKDNKGTG